MLIKKFPTLYKTSNAGKIQEWDLHVNELADGSAEIITVHGQRNGKKQTARVHVTKGKNAGKANATNPVQQAVSEAESKYNKQLDKGYSEEMGAKAVLRPMLAQSFDKHAKKIVYPVFVQPKLDGVRCLAYKKGSEIILESRKGKRFKSLKHIEEFLDDVFKKYPGLILDGELYNSTENFQELSGIIRRDKTNPKSIKIHYHIYDIINEKSFDERNKFIEKLFDSDHLKVGPAKDFIIKVETFTAKSKDEVDKLHDKIRGEGYEGIMLRNSAGPYQPDKRSYDLQKYKVFQDQEFKIVGAEEGVGKFEGICTFVCETDTGAVFRCTPEGTDDVRHEYWVNRKKYIGKFLTVRFFEWTTSDPPLPRFPVGISIRDYE